MFSKMDEMVSSGQGTVDGDYGFFSSTDHKRFNSSYYNEDPPAVPTLNSLVTSLAYRKGTLTPHTFLVQCHLQMTRYGVCRRRHLAKSVST